MKSSGNQPPTISPETVEFAKLLGAREVVNIKYTDLDGVEHELGMRTTKNFADYLVMLNTALVAAQVAAKEPKGGFKA